MKKILVCILITVLFASCTSTSINDITESQELYEESHSETPALIDAMVNIEGKITEISKDGKNFKLDNGKWVITDSATKMGISGPNAAQPKDQFFEPSFRIGNSIAGFSETPEGEIIVAYAIYTNWNWEKPIRR